MDANNEVGWSYLLNGNLASRIQLGQPANYFYDPGGNLVAPHEASGPTDFSQTAVDTQNSYGDLDRLPWVVSEDG